MRTQDQLTELIHSLTASEKKYFRQFISVWGSSKNYETLFDAMLKQEEYDADELSRKLRKTKKQIADEKNYLQEVLLKALRNYDELSTNENRLTNAYLEVQALSRRGMNAMALRMLDKIYPEIIEYELHGLYLAVFFVRMELMYREGLAASPGTVPRAEFEEQIAVIRELTDYTELYHNIGPYVMKRSDPAQAAGYLKDPLLTKKTSVVRSQKAKSIYLNIHNSLQTLVHGLGGKGLGYAEELVSLFEKDGKMRKVHIQALPYAYIRVALSSPFSESTRSLSALQKAKETLDGAPQLFHPHVRAKMEQMILLQQMVILNGIQNYVQCEKTARELLNMKVEGEHQGRLMIVYYLFAHSLAMNGRPTEANNVLHQIFALPLQQRVDLLLHARMLQLIIQIEFGNYGLLPSMIKSTRGWIRKNKLEDPATEYVMKWILQVAKEPAGEKRKALFKSMADDIEADKAKDLKTVYASTLNLKYWIEKKLSDKRFAL
ncbi:MAG: hypothetical protein JWO03_3707 [Bacteroidetes bacterium]|nr:hypothetical protein [Bacteroidota bacterium]